MGFSQGYGPAVDAESVRTIRGCIDAGVTMLDTAQSYGGGHNERLAGSVLAFALRHLGASAVAVT